jgi:predicted transglutaminase-like cysteine proteinase
MASLNKSWERARARDTGGFGDVKMSGRVATLGIAGLFLIMAVVSGGETSASFDPQTPAAAVSVAAASMIGAPQPIQLQAPPLAQDRGAATMPEQAQGQEPAPREDQAPLPPQHPANADSRAQMTIASLDPAQPIDAAPRPAMPTIQPPAVAEPFGLQVAPVTVGEILRKWNGVEADIRAERDVLARCRADADTCPFPARNFLAIVAQGRAHSGRARLGIINRAVNLAIRPMSDLEQWGVIDRWSAPLDTFTTGLGDCEDYAIAKYVALQEAGIAVDDVKLVIVRNLAAGEDHAVVAARLDGAWIILDNRWLTMLGDRDMPQTVPLFVLDDAGVNYFASAAPPDGRRTSALRDDAAIAPGSAP